MYTCSQLYCNIVTCDAFFSAVPNYEIDLSRQKYDTGYHSDTVHVYQAMIGFLCLSNDRLTVLSNDKLSILSVCINRCTVSSEDMIGSLYHANGILR